MEREHNMPEFTLGNRSPKERRLVEVDSVELLRWDDDGFVFSPSGELLGNHGGRHMTPGLAGHLVDRDWIPLCSETRVVWIADRRSSGRVILARPMVAGDRFNATWESGDFVVTVGVLPVSGIDFRMGRILSLPIPRNEQPAAQSALELSGWVERGHSGWYLHPTFGYWVLPVVRGQARG